MAEALTELCRSALTVSNFALGQRTPDEVFLALTGRPAESQEGQPTVPFVEEPAV